MKKEPVLCVSAGLLKPKKADTPLARRHRYLNYGLLCLASVLRNRGYEIEVVHGDFCDPRALAADLAATGLLAFRTPILLSLPSYLSLSWAASFVSSVKETEPDKPLVVGGRWVVQNDGDWVLKRLPGVDLGVYGTAEDRIERILKPENWRIVPGTTMSSPEVAAKAGRHTYLRLAYGVVRNFIEYPPSIEVSRGCGSGCAFCQESAAPLLPLREPEDVLAAVLDAIQWYGSERITPYFEASSFCPNLAWAQRLAELWRAHGLRTTWRCEARVDTVSCWTVRQLAKAGLKVIDLGLESASGKQLRAMGKTSDPRVYLKRASNLLRTCRDEGIWAKVNILLYAGEELGTIEETLEWLDERRPCLKGISAGPLIAYGHTNATKHFLERIARLGAVPVDSTALDLVGYAGLNLSPTLDWQTAQDACRNISRRYMSARDYFDLKAFSYFARSYTFADFSEDVAQASQHELPFSS